MRQHHPRRIASLQQIACPREVRAPWLDRDRHLKVQSIGAQSYRNRGTESPKDPKHLVGIQIQKPKAH